MAAPKRTPPGFKTKKEQRRALEEQRRREEEEAAAKEGDDRSSPFGKNGRGGDEKARAARERARV